MEKEISAEKIAYVKHPVSQELKKELRDFGFKIIDARFAPEGSQIYGVDKGLTVKEIKKALDEMKIEYSNSAVKAELEKLLEDALAAKD